MAKFILTNKAVVDISKIWDYTYETWSENQADNYYKFLIAACNKIAKNPTIGKNNKDISMEIFGLPNGRHIILYRIMATEGIQVIRILPERMELKNRMNDTLPRRQK